jgi:hypothetical protein
MLVEACREMGLTAKNAQRGAATERLAGKLMAGKYGGRDGYEKAQRGTKRADNGNH